MKRLSILLVLLTLTAFVYGLEIQVGPSALYNYYIDTEVQNEEDLSIDDFTFGAEGRVSMGILEVTALGLYSPPWEDPDFPLWVNPATLEVFATAGIVVDFALLRAGIGVGPNMLFILDDGQSDPINLGANMKTHVDLVLNDISISLNYIVLLPDLTIESIGFSDTMGLVGVSVLFKL